MSTILQSKPCAVATAVPPRNSLSYPLVAWHLLSLDAPTVAVLWTIFTARLAHVGLPYATALAMALAVWTLYAADRLLDTRSLAPLTPLDASSELEPRHLFHHRHRSAFLCGIAVSAILLAALLPRLEPASIPLYLTEAALMSGYFLLIHAVPANRMNYIPKELIVGPFFAAATFIPTITRKPSLRPALLPAALLFGALCCLNCLFIYAWEHPDTDNPNHPPHWTTRRLVAHLTLLGAVLTLIAGSFTLFLKLQPPTGLTAWPYPAACTASTLALLLLHRYRSHLSRLSLRAAADAALLTPLLLFPFLA